MKNLKMSSEKCKKLGIKLWRIMKAGQKKKIILLVHYYSYIFVMLIEVLFPKKIKLNYVLSNDTISKKY